MKLRIHCWMIYDFLPSAIPSKLLCSRGFSSHKEMHSSSLNSLSLQRSLSLVCKRPSTVGRLILIDSFFRSTSGYWIFMSDSACSVRWYSILLVFRWDFQPRGRSSNPATIDSLTFLLQLCPLANPAIMTDRTLLVGDDMTGRGLPTLVC